jgi:hypothetical protein
MFCLLPQTISHQSQLSLDSLAFLGCFALRCLPSLPVMTAGMFSTVEISTVEVFHRINNRCMVYPRRICYLSVTRAVFAHLHHHLILRHLAAQQSATIRNQFSKK